MSRNIESARPALGGFAALGVPARLVDVLTSQGITEPFPIQAASLPDSLSGRDVLGRGRTGSGKTVAFALPLVAALMAAGERRAAGSPRALVLVPTRELAGQVAAVLGPLTAAVGLRTTTIFGGVSQGRQVTALASGVDVVVACPGRLEDLIRQGRCRLDKVEVTVLDEADHMADLGFLPAVKRLLDLTPRDTQRLLFSATLDRGVDVLVRRYLNDPVTHSVDSAESPVSTMDHFVLSVAVDEKSAVVRELVGGLGRTIAFTRTKHQAKKLAKALTREGVPSVDLHGNLSQQQRERNLAAFRAGDVPVLVATDIAARGIHVDDINLVVHVEPPVEHKAYLHRSGRTARAGADGTVVTVVTPAQERDVRTLMRRAGITPALRTVSPGHAAITELAGPPAPYVTPAPERVEPQQQPRRQQQSSQSRARRATADVPRERRDGGRGTAGHSHGRGTRSGAPRPAAPRSDRPGTGRRAPRSRQAG